MNSAMKTRGHVNTILLVEDEDFVRNVTREVLELAGYRVFEAIDAENGFELYSQHADEVDLLLTDVVMPGMNGKEFAARIASKRPDLKIVYMSGYTDNEIVREGFSDPSQHYLQKPFTLDALLEKVSELMQAHREVQPPLLPDLKTRALPIEASSR